MVSKGAITRACRQRMCANENWQFSLSFAEAMCYGSRVQPDRRISVVRLAERQIPTGGSVQPPPAGNQDHIELRDADGRQVVLGTIQKFIVRLLGESPRELAEVAGRIKEDEGRARTRLRQLATKGVAELTEDGMWKLVEGPIVPREPPPDARWQRRKNAEARKVRV